jgi:ABC-type sugar transport system ATPase subunit
MRRKTEPLLHWEKAHNGRRMLEVRNLVKRFPGVYALRGVSLQVRRGEVRALVGENGAGKSTLGKILCGIHQPDEGEIFLDGERVFFSSPRAAILKGVSMVHQELVACPNLSVAENICLHHLPRRGIFLHRQAMLKRAEEVLSLVGARVNPHALFGELPPSHQQMVQIATALGRGARWLIFDEPTSSLTAGESKRLFQLIRELKAQGVTILYITHRLEEVFEMGDEVTVLRDGEVVGTLPVKDTDKESLVRMMVGREVEPAETFLTGEDAEVALEVRNLSSPGKIHNISFRLRWGEILGLAGLVGSGRTEIVRALYGLDPGYTGEVLLKGKPIRITAPSQALRHGIALIPEDRQRQGLVSHLSAKANLSLPVLSHVSHRGILSSKKETELAEEYFSLLRIHPRDPDRVVSTFSGGNQQKVVLGKGLAAKCEVLLIDEPTRGVDVGARSEVHSLLTSLAKEGKAILLISSDLPELLTVAHRILVLREGRLVGELLREEATEERVMRLMTGLEEGGDPRHEHPP